MTDMTVAKTILEQLGGNKFMAMTGARSLTGTANGLNIKLPSNFAKDGINYVQVELTQMDDYTVTFSRVRDLKVVEVARHEGAYAEDLQAVFTSTTGLAVRL